MEIQKDWIMGLLAERPDLDVLWLDGKICSVPYKGFIAESASAKEGRRKPREAFWKMLDLIRKNGVDYVIVYHPSRISRNNEDMTNFMQVLDPKRHTGHGVIRRGVITDTGEYSATDPHGVVVFEGLLNAAKAENEHRSITAKKNEEFYKKRGIYPHRFPYGYESLWEKAAVRINPTKRAHVEAAFNMRRNGCKWEEIRQIFPLRVIEKTGKKTQISGDTIKKMLSSPIYYGEFFWNWKLHPIRNEGYNPIISKPLFDEVRAYNSENPRKHGKSNPFVSKESGRFFDKMVFNTAGQPLQGYQNSKTWGVFYRQPTKNPVYDVSISEAKLLRAAANMMEKFSPSPVFLGLIEIALQTRLGQSIIEEERKFGTLDGEILRKKEQIEWLIDRISLTGDPSLAARYEQSLKTFMEEQGGMENELKKLRWSSKDIKGMVVRYAEHFKDLSDAFRKVSNHEKANILRGLGIYFIVGPDKYITVMNAQYEELFIIQ